MDNYTLVTGADGFIGSHLVEKLVEEGKKVKAFCMYNSFNSLGWLENSSDEILNEVEIFMGDIRDPNGVRVAMKNCKEVLHLAALIAIPYSYHSPDSYIDTNIKGTLNVLQASKDLSLERILITSTSEVYGTARYIPIDENHIKQPQSPYSASKIGADAIAESFYRSFNLPITIVRPFNTYGPRQSARAIIPTIISQLLNGYDELKLGDLTPTRDFLYVKDTVNGFYEILESEDLIGEDCNICTSSEISMRELVENMIELIKPDTKIILDPQRLRPKKSEVYRLYGDNSKLLNYTNWKMQYSLKMGLQETIKWFELKNNLKHYKADIYNI